MAGLFERNWKDGYRPMRSAAVVEVVKDFSHIDSRRLLSLKLLDRKRGVTSYRELSRGVSFSKMKKVLCQCLDPDELLG